MVTLIHLIFIIFTVKPLIFILNILTIIFALSYKDVFKVTESYGLGLVKGTVNLQANVYIRGKNSLCTISAAAASGLCCSVSVACRTVCADTFRLRS